MTTTRQLASGIRFNDCFFSEPVSFANWMPPGCPGLFAILIVDPNWAPKPVRPLYFGEFGNDTPAHALFHDCSRVVSAAHGKNLFVCMLPMPYTTTAQRCALRNELISAYNPFCQTNQGGTPPRDLASKVDDLERRHQEHNAQVMLLVAGVSRLFDPPLPPQPRRPIGFMPPSEPAPATPGGS